MDRLTDREFLVSNEVKTVRSDHPESRQNAAFKTNMLLRFAGKLNAALPSTPSHTARCGRHIFVNGGQGSE